MFQAVLFGLSTSNQRSLFWMKSEKDDQPTQSKTHSLKQFNLSYTVALNSYFFMWFNMVIFFLWNFLFLYALKIKRACRQDRFVEKITQNILVRFIVYNIIGFDTFLDEIIAFFSICYIFVTHSSQRNYFFVLPRG